MWKVNPVKWWSDFDVVKEKQTEKLRKAFLLGIWCGRKNGISHVKTAKTTHEQIPALCAHLCTPYAGIDAPYVWKMDSYSLADESIQPTGFYQFTWSVCPYFGRSAIKSLRNGLPNMNVLWWHWAHRQHSFAVCMALTGQAEQYMFYEAYHHHPGIPW